MLGYGAIDCALKIRFEFGVFIKDSNYKLHRIFGLKIIPVSNINEALPYVFDTKNKRTSTKNNQKPKFKKQTNSKKK